MQHVTKNMSKLYQEKRGAKYNYVNKNPRRDSFQAWSTAFISQQVVHLNLSRPTAGVRV